MSYFHVLDCIMFFFHVFVFAIIYSEIIQQCFVLSPLRAG